MKRALLPLNALRAFEAAAKHLSFKKAADELNVTPAAISQQIRTLEEYLDVRLFRRSNRGLILTERAQLALAPLRDGFERLDVAVEMIRDTGQSDTLRVSVSPSLASKWLIPRLDRFYEQNPNVIVKINASMGLTDFKDGETDLALRYGGGNYAGLHVAPLLKETIIAVCSPSLVDERGCLTPADIAGLTVIHDDSSLEDESSPTWAMWQKAAGIAVVSGQRALHFNQTSLAIEAAVAGKGIALAKSSIAQGDLDAGRLVRLFGAELPVNFAHYIVCPKQNLRISHVQAFIQWLEHEAGTL
jgi:LysR family transcriptional regulator, glycine cleavage system transcriptional activator